jgi:peptide/nickel transport system permease protein
VAGLVLRRLVALPFLLLAVAAMTFAVVAASPYNPISSYTAAGAYVSEETRGQIAATWGFDAPIHEQFLRWLGNLAQGDLGNSRLLGGAPVAGELAERIPASLLLIGAALGVVLVGGLVMGVLAAAFRDSRLDWLIRGLCYFNTAAPSFWIGLLALYVFSVWLGLLPAGGVADYRSLDAPAIDPRHLILPTLTLAATQYAWFTMFVRNTMLEVLNEDYVLFARAQGVRRAALLFRHALPNALIPFVTLLGTHVGELLGGAVLAERIFGWPGVGDLAVRAALSVDLPLLMAITLASSFLVVVGNLVADVLYRVVDPRIREARA